MRFLNTGRDSRSVRSLSILFVRFITLSWSPNDDPLIALNSLCEIQAIYVSDHYASYALNSLCEIQAEDIDEIDIDFYSLNSLCEILPSWLRMS